MFWWARRRMRDGVEDAEGGRGGRECLEGCGVES